MTARQVEPEATAWHTIGGLAAAVVVFVLLLGVGAVL